MTSAIDEVQAPYANVDFDAKYVLVACPAFEKAPGARTAYAVPKEILAETQLIQGPDSLGLKSAIPEVAALNTASTSGKEDGGAGADAAASASAPSNMRSSATVTSMQAALSSGIFDFPQIPAEPLRLCLVYLEQKAANGGKTSVIPQPVEDALSKYLQPWEANFLYGNQQQQGGILRGGTREGNSDAERVLLSEVIIAADFLGIPSLLELCGACIAAMLQNRTAPQIRALFGITDDFTTDEHKKFRDENGWADEAMSQAQPQ